MQSQPPPKGSLEELFRHHLLESEAAAVPPRPLVWEHIDNGLLQAQNEKYRRRLLAYRWGMAASLLLATMAGGGWWHSQQQQATATLASANAQHEAARHAVNGAVPASPRTYASSTEATSSPIASTAARSSVNSSETQVAGGRALATGSATPSQTGHQGAAETSASQLLLAGRSKGRPAAGALAYATTSAPARRGHGASRVAGAGLSAHSSTVHSSNAYAIAATATPSSATSASALASAPPLAADAAASLPSTALGDNALAATNRWGEDALATRLASLPMAPATGLPTELAMQNLPTPAPALLRSWRYGAEYTIGAFQPNIDFNRSATTYNTALGINTVSLTRAAAAEYRANLRPGLSQRIGLRATRWLGGHWSLSTGIEMAQQEAYSATSAAFTGEQLADINSFSAVPSTGASTAPNMAAAPRSLQESSFRYRSAGVPIELQYDNQAKSGLSFYGRLGVIVSALLNVRSEVAGNSEATRTYSLTSASTPYRRLTALLRGSAGVRYRPAGRTWGLNVGPTAEAGVQSMNAETDRGFWQQSRPYSVGIEAGIEFGGFKPVQ